MLKTVELTCIGCPIGCALTVTLNQDQVESVSGNECGIGVKYAKAECTNPTRMLTSVVRVKNGTINMLPVKTDKDIPKDKLFESIALLKDVIIIAPIHVGDLIIEDILGTGINFIATRKIDALT